MKKDALSGIINLFKPAGMTSHDCISFLRRKTGERRIGHTGTLDPNACGVLPVCIGKATRLIEYMDKDEKSYICEMILGLKTDTEDIWGTVLEDDREELKNLSIGEEDVLRAISGFIGESEQLPPMYSAIKVRGKKLYEYARTGKAVEISPRKVHIRSIELLRFNPENNRVLFSVNCSRGTYVRSLCRDIGEALDTCGSMSFLLRTKSSSFSLEDTVLIEDVEASNFNEDCEFLLPVERAVAHMDRIEVSAEDREGFSNGRSIRGIGVKVDVESDVFAVFSDGVLLGIARIGEDGKEAFPVKVLI